MAMSSNLSATPILMRATISLPRAAHSIKTSSAGRLAVRFARIKIFFFADYQGTRSTQGIDSGEIPVPSAQDRMGNLSDMASSFVTTDANGNTIPTTVSGPYFANLLSQKLNYPVSAG